MIKNINKNREYQTMNHMVDDKLKTNCTVLKIWFHHFGETKAVLKR